MTHPEIVLGILSRGRLESLRRCVNSALSLASVPISILVLFDDDIETYHAFKTPRGVKKKLLLPRHYYVKGTNELFENFLEAGVDVFALCNNDCEFIEPEWGKIAKEELWNAMEDGMGVLEMSNSEQSLHTFISRIPFFKKRPLKRIFDPVFTQYYADRHLLKKLEEEGKYVKIMPGLTISHTCHDEIKGQGMHFFFDDQELFYRMHPDEYAKDKAKSELGFEKLKNEKQNNPSTGNS